MSDFNHFDFVEQAAEAKKFLAEIVQYDEELRGKLSCSPELSELYKKASKATGNYYSEQIDTYYLEAFKFGFRMCLEILDS